MPGWNGQRFYIEARDVSGRERCGGIMILRGGRNRACVYKVYTRCYETSVASIS